MGNVVGSWVPGRKGQSASDFLSVHCAYQHVIPPQRLPDSGQVGARGCLALVMLRKHPGEGLHSATGGRSPPFLERGAGQNRAQQEIGGRGSRDNLSALAGRNPGCSPKPPPQWVGGMQVQPPVWRPWGPWTTAER